MNDFLLELRCEEVPARMQAGARAELEKLFRREMDAVGVTAGEITVWSTPRRLALIARDLPEATEAVSTEEKGPPVGAPDQAIDGFCRKNGVERGDLEVRDVKGRETYFAVKNVPGRATADVLAEAIPAIVRDFSWPKSMRWGTASLSTESQRWVRPLSGIVALLGEDLVECEVASLAPSYATKGHRFHCPGEITIGSAADYAEKLRACHVIVNHEERQDLIREQAAKAAADAGLTLVEDEGLVIENAGLTEWPVPLLGRFDEQFLDVPPEVIQLTARVNQKYFVCESADGKLANAFVCTANIAAEDGGAAIVDGNRKVLAARLSDARFFWELDQKTPLAEQAKKLERITFHEKLGTVADKVERVAKLARWLAEEGIVPNSDPDLTEQAARLAKADLVTEMVGEFPELQGLMGGYYAEKEGLPQAVSDAIRDHYKPVGQGDEVPTAPVTVAVSLADKLDTVFQFFRIDEKPTGSKDPFALRRAALGMVRLSRRNNLRWSIILSGTQTLLGPLFKADHERKTAPFLEMLRSMTPLITAESAKPFVQAIVAASKDMPRLEGPNLDILEPMIVISAQVRDFLLDRLEVICRDEGIRPDIIQAATIIDGDRGKEDDLVRLLARVHALQAFVQTEDGTNLLAGYKRAANILKKEDWDNHSNPGDLSYTPDAAEKALIDALDTAEPQAAAAIADEDFAKAMAALASLRTPIDAFFTEVTVNDENPAKRNARLNLLARFRVAVHNVADFSKIEG